MQLARREAKGDVSLTALICRPSFEPSFRPVRFPTPNTSPLERSEVRLNRRDSRIRRVLIQPAGWMEASRNGRTLFSGFARPGD